MVPNTLFNAALTAMLCLVLSVTAVAQAPLCVDYGHGNPHVGWTHLPFATVPGLVIDDLAYLGGVEPYDVSVVDISEPPTMPRLSFVRMRDRVLGLVRDGERVYVHTNSGAAVLDVSNPRDPFQLAWIPLDNLKAIQPDGDVLHVAQGPWGYTILDVSDPAEPRVLAELGQLGNIQHLGLDRSRDLVVVGLAGQGMRLVDAADPRAPLVIATLTDVQSFPQMEFVGTDLFLGGGIFGLRIYDVSSPLDPRLLADVTEVDNCVRFAIQDGLMLVCDATQGVHVFDVSRPPRVARVAHHPQLQRTLYAAPANGLFMVNLFTVGWTFMDPTVDWLEPPLLGGIAAPGVVDDLAVSERTVFGVRTLAPNSSELFIAPLSPTLAGSPPQAALPLAHPGGNLALGDDHAFLTAGTSGISVVDIHDPRSPVPAAQLPLDGDARAVALDEPWLHVGVHGAAPDDGGVVVVDVADPAAPMEFRYVPLFQAIDAVDVVGHTVVAASERGGLFTIGGLEPGDPPDPVALALLDLGFDRPRDLAVRGDLVYVGGRGHLAVVDCSDPASPELIWTQPLLVQDDQAQRLALIGQRLYVTSSRSGLAVYDVTEPTAPVFVGLATSGGPDHGISGDTQTLVLGGDGVARYLPLDCDLTGPVGRHAPSVAAPTTLTAYPVPANPRVTVRFELARAGQVTLTVFDLRGRRVADLVQGALAVGEHRVAWDGNDRSGRPAATGTYLLRLTAPGVQSVRKLALVR